MTESSWCPLEGTKWEGYCSEEVTQIKDKTDSNCVQAARCLDLKNLFDSYEVENNNGPLNDYRNRHSK
jgi:hypothetical protein